MANQGNNQQGNTTSKSGAGRDQDGQFTSTDRSQNASSKNDRDTGGSSQRSGSDSSSKQGGTPEQHANAGKQSHKNS